RGEKQGDADRAAIEIGAERAMHDPPGAIDEFHRIAEPIAAIAVPQRVAAQSPAEKRRALQKSLVAGCRHAARLCWNSYRSGEPGGRGGGSSESPAAAKAAATSVRRASAESRPRACALHTASASRRQRLIPKLSPVFGSSPRPRPGASGLANSGVSALSDGRTVRYTSTSSVA